MMGLIRTLRPVYQSGYVMEFYVKNKEVFYKISKWNVNGTNQGSLQKGKLDEQDPEQIMNQALQLFGDLSKN